MNCTSLARKLSSSDSDIVDRLYLKVIGEQIEYSQAEIDKSYEATIATLSAMASFLDENLNRTEQGMDFSAPFKEFNALQNNKTQEP